MFPKSNHKPCVTISVHTNSYENMKNLNSFYNHETVETSRLVTKVNRADRPGYIASLEKPPRVGNRVSSLPAMWIPYFQHIKQGKSVPLLRQEHRETTQSAKSWKDLPYLAEGRGDLESILQILCFLLPFGRLKWCSNLSYHPGTSRENLIGSYVHKHIVQWKRNLMVLNELSEVLHKYLQGRGY